MPADTREGSAPSLAEARGYAFVVRATIRAPGVTAELCDFPEIRGEEFTSTEAQPVVSLGLSPLLPGSQGRYRPAPGRPFARFGQLHFRPAGVSLQVRYGGGPFSSIRVRFEPRHFAKVTGLRERWSDEQLLACLDVRQARIEDALLRLSEECSAPRPGGALLAGALGTVILVELGRYLQDAQDRGQRRHGGLSAHNLRRIAAHLAASTGRTQVGTLAQLCGLSRHHFMRAFRLSTGLTVAKYVEAARISRAKTLLVARGQPIREIARRLGFPGPAAFATVFRRATGRTPSDYRGHRR
ncbi:MAG TPA: AraC family transcriptional regulator [Steroidobacteraceae bacterium]|jgi:AraC family transcriptional regulator